MKTNEKESVKGFNEILEEVIHLIKELDYKDMEFLYQLNIIIKNHLRKRRR